MGELDSRYGVAIVSFCVSLFQRQRCRASGTLCAQLVRSWGTGNGTSLLKAGHDVIDWFWQVLTGSGQL